jgi:hypothetical protein
MTEVLCKDCKHSKANLLDRLLQSSYAFKCTIEESWNAPKPDRVTGNSSTGYYDSCAVMRVGNACGPDAKRWVPKDSKMVFMFLQR